MFGLRVDARARVVDEPRLAELPAVGCAHVLVEVASIDDDRRRRVLRIVGGRGERVDHPLPRPLVLLQIEDGIDHRVAVPAARVEQGLAKELHDVLVRGPDLVAHTRLAQV